MKTHTAVQATQDLGNGAAGAFDLHLAIQLP